MMSERIKRSLIIGVVIVVIYVIAGALSGCEIKEGMKSDRRNLEGCEPTTMYVYESNPLGVRQIYSCGEMK